MITLLPGGYEEADLPYRAQMPPIMFGLTDRPNRGWLRLEDQFVLLGCRAGVVDHFEVELAMAALEDLRKLPIQRGDPDAQEPQREWLLLRGVWFDYMGSVVFFVDLLHDRSIQPSHGIPAIAEQLHDGVGWYAGQISVVKPKVIAVSIHADHFYPIDDQFYERVRGEL